MNTVEESGLHYNEYVSKYRLLCEYIDYIHSELDITRYEEWLENKKTVLGKSTLGSSVLGSKTNQRLYYLQ
ncbi:MULTISPECIES: hypothetical protein [unclassified Francisella]|uniref:hypothetical protein n=1 Tax=unclassified Francisella TaxID=2610885 RepID=UPI002E352E12|nr:MULTISPECIES: hypothetical protein [unclassified Francisella]MED7818894.1 hypothetical protein [Francisella sp. 19S2-4]MED7829731.1 hypothetical protein [Francisella sp. 19S2-10]